MKLQWILADWSAEQVYQGKLFSKEVYEVFHTQDFISVYKGFI